MKIRCECGGIIVDQTDFLPYKGHIISDQDWFDFLDAIDEAIEKSGPSAEDKERACMHIRSMSVNIIKLIYQCTECGRLFIDNEKNELEIFTKETKFQGNSILRSSVGAGWRCPLIGSWDERRNGLVKGYLWCTDLIEGESTFECWELLEKEYYAMFDKLKKKNILRSALLKKNCEVIHSWDMRDEG